MFIMPKSIPRSIVEQGRILKYDIFEDSHIAVSILQLEPCSKVKKHSHQGNEKVIHFNLLTKSLTVCPVGSEHELENSSKTDSLIILSVKIK